MARKLLLSFSLLLVVALAAWAAARARRHQPEWSSRSPAALAELRAGMDAERKYYNNEAREHFQKALELDPQFAIARVQLLKSADGKESKALVDALSATDRSRLTPREAMLVD